MKTNWSDYEVFLKPIHLKGQAMTLTIVRASEEKTHPNKGETVISPVLWFRELPFGMILSPTNRKMLADLYGDPVSNAFGKPIVVKAIKLNVAGNGKEPIRIQNVRPNAPAIELSTGEIVEPSPATESPASHSEPADPTDDKPASELDKFFGPNPRTAQPALPQVPNASVGINWPTTKSEFEAWLKAKGINGQETRSALGTDAASWLKLNAGRTWADVAKTIAGTLGK